MNETIADRSSGSPSMSYMTASKAPMRSSWGHGLILTSAAVRVGLAAAALQRGARERRRGMSPLRKIGPRGLSRPSSAVPDWSRAALGLLAVPQLLVGLWAVFNPRHFYDHFPGFGPLLVAAEPPFNAHLVSDAGAGSATGARHDRRVGGACARWSLSPGVVDGLALPHFAYHLFHPAELLSGPEYVGTPLSPESGSVKAAGRRDRRTAGAPLSGTGRPLDG